MAKEKPKGPWACRKFPELHPRLRDHALGCPSRMAVEKWLQPESVVGTKAWLSANGGYKRGALSPGRDTWVLLTDGGAIHGNPAQADPPVFGAQPPGGSRWAPTRRARGPRLGNTGTQLNQSAGDPAADLTPASTGMKEHRLTRAEAGSLLASSTSLPNLDAGEMPYPPSAAYVRMRMRALQPP